MRLAALGIVALAIVVAVGNWERSSRAAEQSDGMRRVLGTVGELDAPDLSGFRILANFQCLAYERERNSVAYEVCVDSSGRVVEAIDRADGTPQIWSLRDDPTRSDVTVDRALVDRLLRTMTTP